MLYFCFTVLTPSPSSGQQGKSIINLSVIVAMVTFDTRTHPRSRSLASVMKNARLITSATHSQVVWPVPTCTVGAGWLMSFPCTIIMGGSAHRCSQFIVENMDLFSPGTWAKVMSTGWLLWWLGHSWCNRTIVRPTPVSQSKTLLTHILISPTARGLDTKWACPHNAGL